ncbi:MAG: hypothetical protein PHN75_00695, partial [Syntrophales bacterium]|nr:hypothetical protein [Syntrophales bacterium]
MKCTTKPFTAVLVVLLTGAAISVSSGAFAQDSRISSSVKDFSLTTPDIIELSDMTASRTENISMGGKNWWKDKPEETKQSQSWEKGTGKSYFIPALEIPAFLLLLNGYDRLAYPNSVEPDGKKTYDSTPSTFWDHVVHGPWGVDQDSFAMNQFGHPYQGRSEE